MDQNKQVGTFENISFRCHGKGLPKGSVTESLDLLRTPKHSKLYVEIINMYFSAF